MKTALVEPTLIETIITLGMPLLSADDANREIIRLTVELMKAQAQIDAAALREGES